MFSQPRQFPKVSVGYGNQITRLVYFFNYLSIVVINVFFLLLSNPINFLSMKRFIMLNFLLFFQLFDCRNHVRVIQPMENGKRLYVCGTNAHNPKDYVIYVSFFLYSFPFPLIYYFFLFYSQI